MKRFDAAHHNEMMPLGRLRHRTFYSLAEVNAAIGELMTHLNEERPIRRLGVTRRQLPDGLVSTRTGCAEQSGSCDRTRDNHGERTQKEFGTPLVN